MKTAGLSFVILLLCGLASESMQAGEFSGVVKSHQGEVLTRIPFARKWRDIRNGDKLPVGGLVRIGEGSQVLLEIHSPTIKNDDTIWTILIDTPMTLRFDESTMRRLEIARIASSDSPFASTAMNDAELKVKRPLLRKLEDAWRYILPETAPTATPVGDMKGTAEIPALEDIRIGRNAQTLKFLTPAHGTLFIVPEDHLWVNFSWTPANETNSRYRLRVWKADAPMAPVVAETATTFAKVKLDELGDYYARIESSDGLWVSKIIGFSSDSMDGEPEKLAPVKATSIEFLNIGPALRICSKQSSFPVDLIPKDPSLLKSRYELFYAEIDDDAVFQTTDLRQYNSSKKLNRLILDQSQLRWKLPKGAYAWQLIEQTNSLGRATERRSRVHRAELISNCGDWRDPPNITENTQIVWENLP